MTALRQRMMDDLRVRNRSGAHHQDLHRLRRPFCPAFRQVAGVARARRDSSVPSISGQRTTRLLELSQSNGLRAALSLLRHLGPLKEFFAGKRLRNITPMLMEQFKQQCLKTKTLHKRDRSPATVNRELQVLSKVFSMAYDNGLVETNPMRRVHKLREGRRVSVI